MTLPLQIVHTVVLGHFLLVLQFPQSSPLVHFFSILGSVLLVVVRTLAWHIYVKHKECFSVIFSRPMKVYMETKENNTLECLLVTHLSNFLTLVSEQDVPKLYPCRLCGKTYMSRQSRHRHMKNSHRHSTPPKKQQSAPAVNVVSVAKPCHNASVYEGIFSGA